MAFLRGAFPSPRHLAFAAFPFRPDPLRAIPSHYVCIPKQLSIWGNSNYGCCVTSEEMFKLACYSVMCNLPEVFMSPDSLMEAWARKYGYLNGADLTSVMDTMAIHGITDSTGTTWKDGPYNTVDWTSDTTLSAAIFQGPIKIAVAADQLQGCGAGVANGWWGTGFKQDNNSDHCTALCGFGSAADLAADFTAAGYPTSVPSGLNPTTRCYGWFTWGTVGIGDAASVKAITSEAYLRTPSTVGQLPVPVPVPPAPAPVPPTPGPLPIAGTTQIGVYAVSWSAVINDPPPISP